MDLVLLFEEFDKYGFFLREKRIQKKPTILDFSIQLKI